MRGLLSKEYARERAKLINPDHNDTDIKPGSYPFSGRDQSLLAVAAAVVAATRDDVRKRRGDAAALAAFDEHFGAAPPRSKQRYVRLVRVGDTFGRCIRGHRGHTGIGVSQRGQQFVTDQHG